MSCAVAGRCGGCPSILQSYEQQLANKRAQIASLFENVEIDVIAEDGLRDRTDLQFRDGKLGLFDLEGKEIVDIGPCPALSPRLREFVQTIDPPPIAKMSLRLRISPGGERGMWIDAANLDVKTLLDERSWLQRRDCIIEIGQRRKPLTKDFKLRKDAELRPWFHTWLGDAPQNLYLPIGGFTQPSLAANQVLVKRVVEMAEGKRWLEVGAGCGNFSLPLAHRGHEVIAVEIDSLAREGLSQAAREAHLHIELGASDMYDPANELPDVDGLLADPPRSGLRRFIDVLAKNPPKEVLYVSCFTETLLADAEKLKSLGYRVIAARGVDQFPQTPHCEWIVRFTRAV
jgi:23S rRNA (uracil1939-C5)-methyltransferase